MFSSRGLFKSIVCPELDSCDLAQCIFNHQAQPASSAIQDGLLPKSTTSCSEPAQKKQRRGPEVPINSSRASTSKFAPARHLPAVERSVSPPVRRRDVPALNMAVLQNTDAGQLAAKPASKPNFLTRVTLNPRMLPSPPASHPTRLQMLSFLHEHMQRLNDELSKVGTPDSAALVLSPHELVVLALDEEESIARSSAPVYANVIKMRIYKLKKMKLSAWKKARQAQEKTDAGSSIGARSYSSEASHDVLTQQQELHLLPRLYAVQSRFVSFGYVPIAPTCDQVDLARKGLAAAQGWEECDRCQTRFKVFPDRRELDGAFTSGGKCTYHPLRLRRPPTSTTVSATGNAQEAHHACCHQTIGESVGCTTSSTHVFKVNDPKRLSVILPFLETPKPAKPVARPPTPICFDCEMGYTTHGMEVIRLTATCWFNGGVLLDILVRPFGHVLDFNSRYSGIWPETFHSAAPYDLKPSQRESGSIGTSPLLHIVSSPAAARALFFDLICPSTPLIGHALENDLNAMRIIHPIIIDTVLLYPHPRGLPIRYSLKTLIKRYFNRDIQQNEGIKGHDSAEDAKAAGDLVRLHVRQSWTKLEREGWTWNVQGMLDPPLTKAEAIRARLVSSSSST